MIGPKCQLCGHEHYSGQPHVWSDKPVAVVAVNKVANKVDVVANTPKLKVANRHGKYADHAKRKQYMREYMASRRATLH